MKSTNHMSVFFLTAAMSLTGVASAQSGDMKDMEKKDMGMQKCMDMKGTKGGNMKGMDMQKCKDMMDDKASMPAMGAPMTTYETKAQVKSVDVVGGKVTLAHGAVKSLNWPAMTMAFSVKDKTLFDKLAAGKKVNVEFKKDGADYVVTAVK